MSAPFAIGDRVRVTRTGRTRANAYLGEDYIVIAGPYTASSSDGSGWTEYVGVWARHYETLRSDATYEMTHSVPVKFIDADTAVLVPREVVV